MRPLPSALVEPANVRIDYLERARRLAPTIDAAAPAIERERRLPEHLLAELFAAGLFHLLLPRTFGGAELAPAVFARVIEAVARHDASTAWCLCQAGGCSMVAAYLPPEAARTIFGDPRSVLAWGPGPGRAVLTEGGYRVTATCSFASGGRHATWLGAHCAVHEPDGTPCRRADGKPLIRTMLFPADQASMTDVWRVIGLNGTGSDSFSVDDLFVPAEHSVSRDDAAERRETGLLYRFTSNSLYSAGFAGVALGIARSTLDAFVNLARDKTPRGTRTTLRENAVIQSEVAQAEARLRSARLFLLSTLEETWTAVEQSGAPTLEQRMQIRLASTYAIKEAKAVVDTAYDAAGASSIFVGNPFERRFRDIHTVAQQVQGRQAHFETVGQFLLDLEPDLTFL
jgi:alkylation response protein AidB-like acyl-CoA dehydrogenase